MGGLAAAFPSDPAVPRGAAYYLSSLLALCIFVPWRLLVGLLTLLLLRIVTWLARPIVLPARPPDHESDARAGATETTADPASREHSQERPLPSTQASAA